MHFQVYILRSVDHDRLYIGQTGDLASRLESHNSSPRSTYTSKYRPWTLVVSIEVSNRSVAMMVEKYLKKKPRLFLERFIIETELQEYVKEKFKTG